MPWRDKDRSMTKQVLDLPPQIFMYPNSNSNSSNNSKCSSRCNTECKSKDNKRHREKPSKINNRPNNKNNRPNNNRELELNRKDSNSLGRSQRGRSKWKLSKIDWLNLRLSKTDKPKWKLSLKDRLNSKHNKKPISELSRNNKRGKDSRLKSRRDSAWSMLKNRNSNTWKWWGKDKSRKLEPERNKRPRIFRKNSKEKLKKQLELNKLEDRKRLTTSESSSKGWKRWEGCKSKQLRWKGKRSSEPKNMSKEMLLRQLPSMNNLNSIKSNKSRRLTVYRNRPLLTLFLLPELNSHKSQKLLTKMTWCITIWWMKNHQWWI